ncbi:MAG: hypothetical protein JWM58_1293 [Rhizobium sp.]|nr:hypothetical protein [Rhizobium sp.]
MAILANYRTEILALADKVRQPEPTLRALLRYTSMQHSECLWGLMPGSLTDEESPFNECLHADLAATKAIILRLRKPPQIASEASVLVSRIDYDMALTGAAFIGCQYSGEEFNTAEFVRPHWNALPGHLPSLIALIALFAVRLGSLCIFRGIEQMLHSAS